MITPLEYFSVFSVLLPCIMVFVSWKKLKLPLKVISVLIFFTLIMEVTGWLLYRNGINNLKLFHVFTWVEALLLFLYLFLLVRDRSFRLIYICLLAAFFCISIYLLVYVEGTEVYNSTQRSIGCIIACLMCFLFFFDLIREFRVRNLKRFPHFWMASAFLLYFGGMLFVNLMQQHNITKKDFGFNIYLIHSALNIMLNVSYIIVLTLQLDGNDTEYTAENDMYQTDNFII